MVPPCSRGHKVDPPAVRTLARAPAMFCKFLASFAGHYGDERHSRSNVN